MSSEICCAAFENMFCFGGDANMKDYIQICATIVKHIKIALADGAFLLSAKLDDVPFVSLFGVESHWKGGPSAHCLM